jgi:hypothetical protein
MRCPQERRQSMSRSARAAAALAAIGALLVCAAGCGDTTPIGPGGTKGAVLYYRDVQPIVQQHCQGCHNPAGFAPFSLVTYDDASAYAVLMAGATHDRIMPPWPPQSGCGDFRDARVLTDADIATLQAWVDGGKLPGDPKDAPQSLPPAGPQLGTPSQTLDPGADYHADMTLTDDYHCFLIDPALTQTNDLIGFDIHPGAKNSVHHVLLFSIPAANVAAAKAKDAAEAGVGWTCFGGTGVMGEQTVAGWVPGSGASAFPPPTGIRLQPGTQIVMQIHYNLLVEKNVIDRTTADLFYSATPVAKPAVVTAVANTTFLVPAGTKEMTVTAELPVKQLAVALWGVVPHMHLHGTHIKVELIHADGSSACAVDIPAWSFHWQQFYYYRQPTLAIAGDKVRLSCTYDNSPDRQPTVNGVKLPPADLRWGEKTTDEMCLNYLYVTAP